MRSLLVFAPLLLSGCGPGLVFYRPQMMTADEMLARATHVFIGVELDAKIEFWPFYRLSAPGVDPGSAKYWKILRRTVRVELVLRGKESRRVVDVYEIFWTGGTTGDWNSTRRGERDLYLVRVENGRYHVVRDWSRSIFPITTGPHVRLALDDSRPFWERFALMNWWIPGSDPATRISYPQFRYVDPGQALGLWRTVKLERGLLRHPSPAIRVAACRELLMMEGWGQDECSEMLTDEERGHLADGGYLYEGAPCCAAPQIQKMRENVAVYGARLWTRQHDHDERRERDWKRILTTINNPVLRRDFCQRYAQEYPGDEDNGCPANRPPPATIVTEQGDVPLAGAWPR